MTFTIPRSKNWILAQCLTAVSILLLLLFKLIYERDYFVKGKPNQKKREQPWSPHTL